MAMRPNCRCSIYLRLAQCSCSTVEFAHYFCSKVAQYVSPIRGALVHGLRHTYATELANSEVSEYTLMKLLGHESMATSQRYVVGAGIETCAAGRENPL
jgi:integrase